MDIIENVPLGPKTTMRIGGAARYFVELRTQKDVEDIVLFAEEKKLPLVVLGGGSNTIFADGMIEVVVARIQAESVVLAPHPNPLPRGEGKLVHVEAGKILASLLNELAEQNLDLSPLTGIPGTVGGAIFGNAGQGFGGTWIGSFVNDVTFYHEKQWRTRTKEECGFGYRESKFKIQNSRSESEALLFEPEPQSRRQGRMEKFKIPPIIWAVTFQIPTNPSDKIKTEIESLLRRRIETQPHLKTAGSCFKSLPDGTPAWKLIDAAGLRGLRVGDIQVAEKHANFLLNVGKATFSDATNLIQKIQSHIDRPLDIEMRFVEQDGLTVF